MACNAFQGSNQHSDIPLWEPHCRDMQTKQRVSQKLAKMCWEGELKTSACLQLFEERRDENPCMSQATYRPLPARGLSSSATWGHNTHNKNSQGFLVHT